MARYFFSLGRERVIPSWFGKTSDRSGAPQSGSIAQTTIGIVAIIIFAVAGNGSELSVIYPVLTLNHLLPGSWTEKFQLSGEQFYAVMWPALNTAAWQHHEDPNTAVRGYVQGSAWLDTRSGAL